jgi:hypothetical protein
MIVLGAALLVAGWVVLGFLTEPSAVGRVRTALVVVGGGAIAVGAIGGITGVWMLVTRRT